MTHFFPLPVIQTRSPRDFSSWKVRPDHDPLPGSAPSLRPAMESNPR